MTQIGTDIVVGGPVGRICSWVSAMVRSMPGSGPIDNAWHLAFGRDAVIWSPPHALGIVGIAGAFVVAALTFLVIEYETDVPQFEALWYLPVLGLTSALALGIVRRATPGPWAATQAASAQLGFVALVSLLLLVLGLDLPKLPLLILSALALDLLSRRATNIGVCAVAYTAVLFVAYVPTVNWLGNGVELDRADVLLGLPLTVLAVAVSLGAILGNRGRAPRRRGGRLAPAIALGAAVSLLLPMATLAHDPGLGDDAGTIDLRGQTVGRVAALTARVAEPLCNQIETGNLVARRSGIARRATFARRGCDFSGRVSVPERGRWFAYAQLRGRHETIESWLPLKVGDGEVRRSPRRDRPFARQRAATPTYAGR